MESSVQRPLTPLSYLSSPVSDLAATLHTSSQAADEADEANVSFLRDSLESLDQAAESTSASSSRHSLSRPERQQDNQTEHHRRLDAHIDTATAAVLQDTGDDISRRERLQRVLARLNRIHDPSGSSASAYGNRTPSPNRQRLYDWAPSQEETGQADDNELQQILAELRRSQPETHPDILRVLRQRQQDGPQQRDRSTNTTAAATNQHSDATDTRDRLRERRRRENEWVSLRSRAVLQRARQESSPSATERMLRYVMERERSGLSEEEERARGSAWLSPGAGGASSRASSSEQQRSGGASANRDSWPLPPAAGELRARTLQERAEVMQRRYMAENAAPRLPRISTPPVPATSSTPNTSSQFLENALKYLNRLRSCCRYEEALSAAMDHGLATKEFFADKHDDFVMDLEELEPLPASSWLQPGSVFEGHQHATSGNAGLLQSPSSSSSSHAVEQINPHYRNQGITSTGFDHPPGSTRVQPFDATRPWLSHQFTPPSLHPASALFTKPPEPSHDHWPVRVTIHSIDAEKMTLQGTMEAYDVPQHPASVSILNSAERPKAGKKHAPITTFLEGHIIDLTTHSFLTPSAKDTQRFGPHPTAPQNATPYTTLSDTISFPSANAHTAASNWRKLPPFNSLSSSEEMARLLLSKGRMDAIHQEYIFMRWKERCFVHGKEDSCTEAERQGDQDRGHGLTISGFYYVSMRRSDGSVEGLYFDPMSTPYQCLRLKGGGGERGWVEVELR